MSKAESQSVEPDAGAGAGLDAGADALVNSGADASVSVDADAGGDANAGAGAGASCPTEALAVYVSQHPEFTRYCIGYSGGRDSHVLLDAAARLFAPLVQQDDGDRVLLRAVHVDHGLNDDSGRWADHCQATAASLDVPLTVKRVTVVEGEDGPEAAARAARYGAFAELLEADEHLLLAQHADDQAETFLLQALRGSGPDGLASMPRKRTFAGGILARPLIACAADTLASYASERALDWIEDPSNDDIRFDRNFLRLEVMPLLAGRWPAMARTLGRSARRSAAASHTLLGLASEDLEGVRLRGATELSVSELRALPRERGYNALRLWVRQANQRMPRLQHLARVFDELVLGRPDGGGIVGVRDYEFRRYGDRLYLLSPTNSAAPFDHRWPVPFEPLAIPEIGIELTRAACNAQGIRLPAEGEITVRSRRGGELIKLGEPGFHKAVKKLLQESAVPPWQRERIPLLYVGERLIAVWKIAVATDFRRAVVKSTDDEPDDDAEPRASIADSAMPA